MLVPPPNGCGGSVGLFLVAAIGLWCRFPVRSRLQYPPYHAIPKISIMDPI